MLGQDTSLKAYHKQWCRSPHALLVLFHQNLTPAKRCLQPPAAAAAAAPMPLTAGYWPLNPVLQTQPARVDIYPGLSGPLAISSATWNNYVLTAPDNATLQYMYDLGRADAAAWVTATLGNVARFNATAVSSALASTAFTV